MHQDLFTLQRIVLLVEVSTLQGPELSMDVFTLQRSLLLQDSIRETRSIIPQYIYFEILPHAECALKKVYAC